LILALATTSANSLVFFAIFSANMLHLDAGPLAQQFERKMSDVAVARRPIAHDAGVCLRHRNQIGQRLDISRLGISGPAKTVAVERAIAAPGGFHVPPLMALLA
jgi:hypothetical protein